MLFITISSTENMDIIGLCLYLFLFPTFLPDRFWLHSNRSEIFPQTSQCPFGSLRRIRTKDSSHLLRNTQFSHLRLLWIRVVYKVSRLFVNAKVCEMDEVVRDGLRISCVFLSSKPQQFSADL